MTDNLRGILAVLTASTAFVLNDALVKLVSAELPSGEIIILRGIMATALFILAVPLTGSMHPLRLLFTPMMLLRLLTAAGATAFIVLAVRYLPLATATTVLQATPLAVVAGSALLYGDKVGWRRWLAAFAGFAGVLLIVQPGGDFGVAIYLILIALVLTTTRDLTTRGLPPSIPSIFVAAGSAVFITLAGLVVLPFDAPWSMPSAGAWQAMGISAVCQLIATTCMVAGLRIGEIAVVAPFRYAPVPLSLLLGWWWWGDVPDGVALVGIALVLGAGLYTLHRERSSLKAAPIAAAQRSPVA
jgi:drug/metabolite transporter (DMT)-like permease